MTQQEHIDEIMDYFDFERVHEVMTFLNWKWHSTNGVPDVYDLRKYVRREINKVWNRCEETGQDSWSSSGGFDIRVCKLDNDMNVSVQFVVEECNSREDLLDYVITVTE